MEVKKLDCRSNTEFFDVKNCSVQAPTKKTIILHLCIFFIKEVKSLVVIWKDTVKQGNSGQLQIALFHGTNDSTHQ
jgi:hypothetical protein